MPVVTGLTREARGCSIRAGSECLMEHHCGADEQQAESNLPACVTSVSRASSSLMLDFEVADVKKGRLELYIVLDRIQEVKQRKRSCKHYEIRF